RYKEGGNEADLNPNIAKRNAAPKKKKENNQFTEEQVEQLISAFEDSLFDYQRDWYKAGNQRTRVILKSRQIGATWYFAREALVDAVKTG
ncbi:terminase family protein, partial [Acinetobacter baumannii]